MPKEHFLSDEAPRLKSAPTEAYDIPLWADPKVGATILVQSETATIPPQSGFSRSTGES